MSSFWRNFHHWLHWKLSFWQLPVQPVMIISSKWRHFRFSVAVGCYNSWAYARCSDCSSLGEISLWNGTVTLMMLADALTTSLTHWGRVAHICVGNLGIIDLGNGLSPGRRQAIIWTNAEILLIGPMGTNFNVSLFEIHAFPFTFHLKMSSGKLRPFCVSLVFIHMAV